MALAAVFSSIVSKLIRVLPCLPQAPFAGVNISGFADTNNCCCSEFSFTIPDFPSGYPSVANILFPTRKSGWFIWACSTASGMLKANRLNSSGLIDTLRDIQRSQFSYLEVLNQTADES